LHIDILSRKISEEVYLKYSLILTLGIYATNTHEDHVKVKDTILHIVKFYPEVKQLHGLFIDNDNLFISFDLVIDFECKNVKQLLDKIETRLMERYRQYKIRINVDRDFSIS
jgi:hypothetical protein